MGRKFVALTSSALLVFPVAAIAGDKVQYTQAAPWVVEHTAATLPDAASKLPISIELLDIQTRMDGPKRSTFTHSMMRINTSQGLQAGNIALSWQPDTDQLIVHKVLIHRGDQTIDVLAEGQKFSVLRRERNLEEATLDGTLTASLFPSGLQVGDVLDVSTTVVSSNPVLGDHAEFFFGPINFPAGEVNLSIEWPHSKKLKLAKSAEMPAWTQSVRNGFNIASLSLSHLQMLVPPNGAPSRYFLVRTAEASDFASWSDVSHLFEPLYAKASQIPASGPLRTELEDIRARYPDPLGRAEAALRLVQDKIRYVALTMGTGGLVPADAQTTWSRRYGDCKAKSALLLGLLRELNIAAVPVTVRSSGGDMLPDHLPAVALFDHILVRATIAGKDYWLDGTRQGDLSLSRLQTPNFKWGLPIDKGHVTLVRILPDVPKQPLDEIDIQLDARKGFFGEVPATVTETVRGDVATGVKQAFAALEGAARTEALRSYWSGQLDFIKPTKMDFTFDEKSGDGKLTLQGMATMDWQNGYYQTDHTDVGYRADFSRTASPNSDAPFAVAYPSYDRTVETILLPKTFPTTGSADKSVDIDETVAGIHYERHAGFQDHDRFVVERTSKSVAPEFPASEAPVAQKRLRELADLTVSLKIPDSYKPTQSDVTNLTSKSGDGDDADALVTKGNLLLNAGKFDSALKLFEQATKLSPENQMAWADRGVAEAWLGKLTAASVSLDQAAAAGPATTIIHHGRGLVALKQRDLKKASAEFSAALALDPEDMFALSQRAMARQALGESHAALVDAKAVLAKNPKWIGGYGIEYVAANEGGRKSDAEAIIKEMLAASGDTPEAKIAAAQMYSGLGEDEKAKGLLATVGTGVDNEQLALTSATLRDYSDKKGKQADFDKAIRLAPKSTQAYFARASFRFSESEYEDALTDVNQALALDKKNAGAYLLKANILTKLGRRAQAQAVAKEIADANPQDSYSQVVSAKIYAHFDMRKEALAAIDRALAIHPDAYIYINRADVMDSDDFSGRLAEIAKALVLQPNMKAALAYKARLLSRSGDHKGAEAIFSQIIAKGDSSSKGYLVNRGVERWKLGRKDDAQADFAAARVMAKTPSDLNNLCYLQAMGGAALDVALDECNEAIKQSPKEPSFLDSRGLVYLRLGRYQDAIADYSTALAKSPNLATSLFGRALAEAKEGYLRKAKQDVLSAEAISPNIAETFVNMDVPIPAELSKEQ